MPIRGGFVWESGRTSLLFFCNRLIPTAINFPSKKDLLHVKSLAISQYPAFSRDFPREEPSRGNSDQALKLPHRRKRDVFSVSYPFPIARSIEDCSARCR